ncbi:gag protease polyprotein [Cucumis melo var. makuwa]|nr:gag protease polyprotein [Cucumis melo var. makuwa]
MPPCRGARRGGGRGGRRAGGRTQPEEQPAVQAADPNAPVTQADLAAMEQRYQDMLQATLAPFLAAQQTQAAPLQAQTIPPPASLGAQPAPVQLSVKAKHLRDFRKRPEGAVAIFFLEDSGTAWWETAERMLGGDVSKITWEQFKESFYAKFFSTNVKHAKQQEFLNLEQGDMTVEQYDAEFDMLSRFAPDVGIVRALRPATHADALCIALDLSLHERADPSKAAGRGSSLGEKRKAESQPALAPQRDLRSRGVFQRHRQKLVAAGRTLRELPACGRCGEFMEEAERVGTVVTVFVRQVGLEVEPLGSILSVSTPSGAVMLSKENIKACQVGVANHMLDVTLLVLDMQDFDVILGMNWLSANHASIDCFRKEVVFNPPSGTSFKFKGAGIVCIPKVISAMKASKLLSQGSWSILASVVDTREPEVSLSSEPVVREYPDVFPDELPGIPPPREIVFAIELEPDTAPISRALYRMAPAELKELKVQLQELLDKGFI